jgi:hypothetical protein
MTSAQRRAAKAYRKRHRPSLVKRLLAPKPKPQPKKASQNPARKKSERK